MSKKLSRIEERMKTELGLELDKTVYRLTYSDVACIIADTISEEEMKLTSEQLDKVVKSVVRSFEYLDWVEVGKTGADLAL